MDFARANLHRLGLINIAMDVFVSADNRFSVNELQAYYGANETGGTYFENGMPVHLQDNQTIEMMINGRSGRYYDHNGQMTFEEGDFSRNAGCNLRVKLAFQMLGKPLPGFLV